MSTIFTVGRLERRYVRSPEIGSSSKVPGPIESADLHCDNCQHEWTSTEGWGVGQFRSGLGKLAVSCPGCGQDGEAITAK